MTVVALVMNGMSEAPIGIDGGLVRALLGMLLVLGLVALLAFLLRRGVIALPGQRGPRAVAVEHSLALGDRRSIVIVAVDGRRFLLGLTSSQINLVTELGSAREAFDQAMARASSSTPGASS